MIYPFSLFTLKYPHDDIIRIWDVVMFFFLWKDMVEMYDRNDESRKMMSFQKIDTLT